MRYHEILYENILDNPSFRKWFGNSKIVANGNPIVVYHGTNKDFDAFDIEKAMSEGGVFYFCRNPGFKKGWDSKSAGGYASGVGGNVIPVYLKMEKPYVTGFTEELPSPSLPLFPHIYDKEDEEAFEKWYDKQKLFDKKFNDDRYKINYYCSEIRYAKKNGYDGVIFKHITDDRYHSEIHSYPSDVYAVFSPNQIKSAIGNKGTFDATTNNISENIKYFK